jgi:SPP1 family phage portal protein
MFTISKETTLDAEIVKLAIESMETEAKNLTHLDNYYRGHHGILSRTKDSDMLANNKLVVNHAKYITDINVGYLLGNPPEYKPLKEELKDDMHKVLDYFKYQTISDQDNEAAKDCSIFGKAKEYTYAMPDNTLRSRTIDPRQCVVIYDDTLEHSKLGAVIFSDPDDNGRYNNILLVTPTEIAEYSGTKDKLTAGKVTFHQFGVVPVVEYRNNADMKGDWEQVTTLIDAYNILMSDRVNDKEQLVEAILLFYGFTMEPEQVEDLKINRMLAIPEGAKAEYLIKAMDETKIDTLRKVIENDIHKISMTPNLSDQEFVGNSSGVAIRYKLIAFEQNIKNKERYFETGLLERFTIYNNYLVALGKVKPIPVYDIDVAFKRNLPQNDLEIAQMIAYLDGKVDNETAISQLSWIENAADITKKARKEAVERATALADQFATDQASKEKEQE